MLDMNVNLLSIDKLLNFDIAVFFYKIEYTLIKNDLKLIDTRNRDLFFLNLWQSRNSALIAYSVFLNLIHQLWHARISYLNQNNLNKLSNIIVEVNFIKNIAKEYIYECYIIRR